MEVKQDYIGVMNDGTEVIVQAFSEEEAHHAIAERSGEAPVSVRRVDDDDEAVALLNARREA
ncbi:MAG: hypothetical protein AAFQ82_25395 [Myxococcota bacterium]